jgi:DNA-binding response OmpR family regulator
MSTATSTAPSTAPELNELPATTAPAPQALARVLLIEDNQEEMLLVQYNLEEFGHGRFELEWCNRLSDGIERLEQGGVDVVLLDLGLPECDGAVSYVAVRNTAPDIPAIVLTGDEREQTEQLVMNYGADDYLIKNEVSGLQLLRAIRSAIYRKRNRSATSLVE